MPETITIAFTDIVDSTSTNLALGDAAYAAIAGQHDKLIRSIAPGAELKTIGDSFMLRFDDPAEAVVKLVDVQKSLTSNPIRLGADPLSVRVGIHVGNPLLVPTPHGHDDYRGNSVNQAARYESLARGGQILISSELRALLKDRHHDLPGITFHDWGPYFLKGLGWRHVLEVLWDSRAPVAPSGRPQHAPRRFLAPFIGREKELLEIQAYLEKPDFPLITLKGPGGIGKTRLADQIERRASQLFDDGTFFVELESTPNNPHDVEEQLRAQCDIRTGTTHDFFANKSALLILNNFESVTSAGSFVAALLMRCGSLRVLATSQYSLQIPGEQLWPVESVEFGDAARMFLEYARRRNPGLSIASADQQLLEQLFRLTDGFPFCIELAAAQARPGRSLKSIVAGIGQSLSALGAAMVSARHGSVAACLDWSFSLLGPSEKELFPKLSVFRGGFQPQDVVAVCDSPEAETLLSSLYDASLLRMAGDRYFLLPTAREYASAKLGPATAGLRRRHAAHYLKVAEMAAGKLRGGEFREGSSILREEFENLRAAILWTAEVEENQMTLRFTYAFSGNLARLLRASEEVQYCEMALVAAARIGNSELEADAQVMLGNSHLHLPTGDRRENMRQAIACYQAASLIYNERDSPAAWASIQNDLGTAYWSIPDGDRAENLRTAISFYEKALGIFTERDFPVDWALTQINLGSAYRTLPTGDPTENVRRAISFFETALRIPIERELPSEWAAAQNNLGSAYLALPSGNRSENFLKAIAAYEASIRVYTEQDFPSQWALVQYNLGYAYRNLPTGDPQKNLLRAIASYEAALRISTERDLPFQWAAIQINLGLAYRNLSTGDLSANLRHAIACYEGALRVFTERDSPLEWSTAQYNLGNAYENSPAGDRAECLSKALYSYENALRGFRTCHLEEKAAATAARIQEITSRAL